MPKEPTPEQNKIFDQLEEIVRNGDVSATRLSQHITKLIRKKRRPTRILAPHEVRNKVIAVRLNTLEKKTVTKLAKLEKKSASELIRKWLMSQAAEKGIK